MKSETVLETALAVIREREQQHGNKQYVLEATARLWSAYACSTFSAADVATMMTLLKVARSQNGQFNPDDYVDACGYAALASEARSWR